MEACRQEGAHARWLLPLPRVRAVGRVSEGGMSPDTAKTIISGEALSTAGEPEALRSSHLLLPALTRGEVTVQEIDRISDSQDPGGVIHGRTLHRERFDPFMIVPILKSGLKEILIIPVLSTSFSLII